MKLPVDTSGMTVISGAPVERFVNFKTGEVINERGTELPIWVTKLVLIIPGEKAGAEVIKVKLYGPEPKPLVPGLPVQVTGLVVSDYAIEDKESGRFNAGLSFRAETVTQPAANGKAAA